VKVHYVRTVSAGVGIVFRKGYKGLDDPIFPSRHGLGMTSGEWTICLPGNGPGKAWREAGYTGTYLINDHLQKQKKRLR
jgi:hypothetical protein